MRGHHRTNPHDPIHEGPTLPQPISSPHGSHHSTIHSRHSIHSNMSTQTITAELPQEDITHLVAFQLLQAIEMELSLILTCTIMSQQLLKLSQSSMTKACGNEGMPYCKFTLKVSQVIQLGLGHPTPSSQVSMILFLVWNN